MPERATSHTEVMRHGFLIQAAALFLWVALVAILGVFVFCPHIHATWTLTTVQVLLARFITRSLEHTMNRLAALFHVAVSALPRPCPDACGTRGFAACAASSGSQSPY